MRRTIFGLWSYFEFFFFALVFLPIMAVVALFTRNDVTCRLRGRWMRRFGYFTSLWTPLWRFHWSGKPPSDIDTKGYVVVCNHQSTSDPFLLSHLPFDMRWIAKEELFRQPVTGWLLRLSGDIPLRRGEKDSVVEMMAECRKTIAAGMSVMIFPEGTRSKTTEMLPFKDGAFQLALDTRTSVVPLVLEGTHAMRPKGSVWFGDADAQVKVLEAIDSAGHTVDSLKNAVRTAMEQVIAEWAAVSQSKPHP
jgi:1-acyl-sn-glycerol-3-phosphate acyltransferase